MFTDRFGSAPGAQDASVWRNRETLLTGGLLILVALVAWGVVFAQSAQMQNMSADKSDLDTSSPSTAMSMTDGVTMNMPDSSSADDGAIHRADTSSGMSMSLADGTGYVVGWGVMMAAMMLPSAVPMIALYGAIKRKFSQTGQHGIPTMLFALVYLAMWLAFGILVYIVSVLINTAVTSNPALTNFFPYALGVVLLAAGAFQFSPLKRACLHGCRNPLSFLLGSWRGGYVGTTRMALEHSAYCIGCCWGLMVVLVAAGAMALQWVLLIAVLVFIEKLLPRGEWTARLIGAAIFLLALLVVVQPELMTTLQGLG